MNLVILIQNRRMGAIHGLFPLRHKIFVLAISFIIFFAIEL